MYEWVVFLHVFAALGFMLAHGGSVVMALMLKQQRDPDQMRALLDLSIRSQSALWATLVLIVLSGIAAGILGHWLGQGWFWASLILLISISLYMMSTSGAQYHPLRRVLGLPYFEGSQKKVVPGLPPAPLEEIYRAQADLRPMQPTAVGLGGILVILALMMFKPF
jgi:uncharacterized membrane protein